PRSIRGGHRCSTCTSIRTEDDTGRSEPDHAHAETEDEQVEDQHEALAVEVDAAHLCRVPAVSPAEASAPGVRELRLLRGSSGPRGGVGEGRAVPWRGNRLPWRRRWRSGSTAATSWSRRSPIGPSPSRKAG